MTSDANDDAAACTAECRVAVCGDGLVHAGVEACDLGDLNSPEGPCSPDCTLVSCGDGNLDPGEACDDGPANNLVPVPFVEDVPEAVHALPVQHPAGVLRHGRHGGPARLRPRAPRGDLGA